MGNIISQLPLVYETESKTSCQDMGNSIHLLL